jgi:hypothetical protein
MERRKWIFVVLKKQQSCGILSVKNHLILSADSKKTGHRSMTGDF